MPFLLDSQLFPYRVLGTERVIPVSRPTAGGPMLDRAIETGGPVPYLSYGDFSFFGVALSKLFTARPAFNARVVHENTISIGLKTMALAGWGLAWLPESLIRQELADGSLMRASNDPDWDFETQIRIYRHGTASRPIVEAFWQAIKAR